MKIVDTFGLPDGIVAAIRNDQYDRGEPLEGTVGIHSPSSLIGPPQIAYLRRIHDDEIEEEAVTRVWSLLGQAVHNILEQATGRGTQATLLQQLIEIHGVDNQTSESKWLDVLLLIDEIQQQGAEAAEIRYFSTIDVDGDLWTISGMLDNMTTATGYLDDYKVTSAWTILAGGRDDWEPQLNIYRWLAWKNGQELDTLTINAILRDWSWRKATESNNYPQTPIVRIPIPVWLYSDIERYIRERIRVHTEEPVPECTEDDQWYKGSQWVLRKVGNKRAVKTEATMEALRNYVDSKNIVALNYDDKVAFGEVESKLDGDKKKGDYYIVERMGERIRCARYCSVAQFCDQRKREGTKLTMKAYGRPSVSPPPF